MGDMLREEVAVYETRKNELVGKSEGKFVLIKDDEVIGVFDSESDAIRQGYARFGNVPFLVKQIQKIEIPANFTSNLLGV